MCKNNFSSRICNELYCIMYCLNVTMVNFKGGSFFLCSVYIALKSDHKLEGNAFPEISEQAPLFNLRQSKQNPDKHLFNEYIEVYY